MNDDRTPDSLFETRSADEVAETMNVSEALYARLWNDVVPLQYRAQSEEDWEGDYWGSECNALASYWHLFSAQERSELNRAAHAYWVEIMGADFE